MSATLINGNISERYRKNIPISEGQGGKTMLIPLILFFLKGRSQLTPSIGRGGGGSVVAIKCFFP